jgi:hypothetical protein
MKRTTVFLTEAQTKRLAAAGKDDGLSASALLRIFINEGLSRRAKRTRAE